MTESELEILRAQIVDVAQKSTYDHRPFMPESVKAAFPHTLDDNQLLYSRTKFAIACVLQPHAIYEVGVGWGVSLRAFEHACPDSHIFAIDSGEMGVDPLQFVRDGVEISCVTSDSLPAFVHSYGQIDLIHIDGGHGRDQKCRDIVKAFQAQPEWILVDDAHNVMVMAGTFDGIWKACPTVDIPMIYIGNSHTGNLLIYCGRRSAENRP